MLKYIFVLFLYFVSLNFLHAEVLNDTTKEDNKTVSISYFFYKNGISYFLSLDHLGNTRAVVSNNIIEAQYDYYPYGKILRKWENIGSRYLSTGHEQDAETGYNARNARWQDAEALGFGQIDPLSDAFPSQSPYSYSNNNPIFYNDPTGMYGDEFSAKNQREVALRMGEDVGEVYQSGKHFLFNGDKCTYKDKDFITEEFEKNKSWYQGFEEGVNDLYNSSPDWVRNFDNEGGIGYESIQLMADMVMTMHPGVNGYSLYTGDNWRGQKMDGMEKTMNWYNLLTFGGASKVNATLGFAKFTSNGGINLLKLAKKYGVNANSQTTRNLLENFDMKAVDWISKYRQGKIKSILIDIEGKTIGEVFDAANSQTRKMILDGRFAK